MSIHFFKSLLLRSASLQREIDAEHARPRPDSLRLLKLKKIRLMIKDRLYRLARQHEARALRPALNRTRKA